MTQQKRLTFHLQKGSVQTHHCCYHLHFLSNEINVYQLSANCLTITSCLRLNWWCSQSSFCHCILCWTKWMEKRWSWWGDVSAGPCCFCQQQSLGPHWAHWNQRTESHEVVKVIKKAVEASEGKGERPDMSQKVVWEIISPLLLKGVRQC